MLSTFFASRKVETQILIMHVVDFHQSPLFLVLFIPQDILLLLVHSKQCNRDTHL